MKQEDDLAQDFVANSWRFWDQALSTLARMVGTDTSHDHAQDWSRWERGIYQRSLDHIYTASKSAHSNDFCRNEEQAVRRHTFPNLYEDQKLARSHESIRIE
jgi:hypothetical protein